MSILIDGRKVKKKDFGFYMPEFLEDSIDDFINACNTGSSLADCYMSELYNNINNCMHGEMTDEQLEQIRDYYIRGGMYEDD